MSLTTSTCRNDYVGNNAASVYAFDYLVTNATDLVVTVASTATPPVQTTLTLGVDYSVSGLSNPSGGNITLINASQSWLTAGDLTTGYLITIRRVVSEVQSTDLRNQAAFYPETIESAFDYVTMICQQLQEALIRALTTPVTITPSAFNPALPEGITTPGAVPTVNAGGNGWSMVVPGAGGTSGTWQQEVPSGTVNGSNTTFTLAYTPVASMTVMLFWDRSLYLQGVDYTISGNTITMTVAPATGLKPSAVYQH